MNLKRPANYADSREHILRPMKIIHGTGIRRGMTKKERESVIDGCLERLATLGYGGIVTNVDLDQYLESEDNWESLRYVIKRAQSLGLRVWLYDEHGYPSGGAGGITLRDNPEFEAEALVKIDVPAEEGTEVTIELPRGHMYFLPAGGVTISGDGLSVVARGGSDGNASAYAVKKVYEGTHAEHNVHESRRYVNVLDPRAIKAFINNTYKAYKKHLGGLFGVCEAVFTDEPSIMAAYINAGLYPGRVRDEFDDTLPLYPLTVWDPEIPEKYEKMWGESLFPRIPDLFGASTPLKAESRYRFFSVTSEMFREAYYRQLADYCRRNGLDFSGHVLLEEMILHHPVFEGNIFRFTGEMGIPGIDMLSTLPERILAMAPTPKLVSSAAHLLRGTNCVMSEVSGHQEGAFKIPFGLREMRASVATQRALGVTVFPSYYRDDNFTAEEFKKGFTDFVYHLTKNLDGGNQAGDILLYYPVEAAMAATSGTEKQLGERPHSREELLLEDSWQRLNRYLLLSGTGYECADTGEIGSMKFEKGVLRHRSGRTFRAVVIPYVNFETQEFVKMIAKLEKSGITVLRDTSGTAESAEEIINTLKDSFAQSGFVPEAPGESEKPENPVLITAFSDAGSFKQAFLAVNTSANPVKGVITLGNKETFPVEESGGVFEIRPEQGGNTVLATRNVFDGVYKAAAAFSPYEAVIYAFGYKGKR